MLLFANTCLTELLYGSVVLGMNIFTFHNDLKRIQYQDSLCVLRGYFGYVVTALTNYSYLIQAIYRYLIVIYPNRLLWQSARLQLFLICLTWIFSAVCPLPIILTGQIKYIIDNEICQLPLGLSFFQIYNPFFIYMIPVSSIVLIYFLLVRHVRKMNQNAIRANTLVRAKRELKMVRRIVILVLGVAMIGIPYVTFIFISFFTTPPKYHFRIAFVFLDTSVVFVMIALFQFTDPLKMFIMRKINREQNAIIPAAT
ncbi:unnamed protein product [Adineta steineri]|uniref:G-protein coupled receptors family 1 profile domain-containing protein n=1 Tax=Adineta steineri TaxID=433720 RepID=A0A814HHI5_9BILA|nr:unnamed protein product [Adineta steineri]CAF3640050.1 unnamed protein product [Adineta steineri]